MNEWKELQIDKLPEDILTGDYEFEHRQLDICKDWTLSNNDAMEIIHILYENRDSEYRYRKPEPKAPTHKEIMIKWWLFGYCWMKAIGYNAGSYYFWGAESNEYHEMPMMANGKEKKHFIGRESADMPPE